MNRDLARKVADAVLYEGYMLYPYRRSAIKNRQRWSFGILYPPDYQEVITGTERCSMHSECLLENKGQGAVQMELRFLHLASHQPTRSDVAESKELDSVSNKLPSGEAWDEGVERAADFEISLSCDRQEFQFSFPATPERDSQPAIEQRATLTSTTQYLLTGAVSAFAEQIREGVLKLFIDIRNTTPLGGDSADRDSALLRSMLSAHVILSATEAQFVSLLDPPKDLHEATKACSNVGNFPVLLGQPGEREMLLCSPIILYDYPQVAPESAGDFYDATEMDEMLTLRVLTLTENEKNQAKDGDLRVRDLMERTEAIAREQLMRTHGAIRSLRPVNEKRSE
jgi:hypothetical protein